MVIYLDVIIIENVVINSFLLYITTQTLHKKPKSLNILAAALLGSLYTITICYCNLEIFTLFPFKTIIAALMVLITFKTKDLLFLLKSFIIFIMYSMLLAGICVYSLFNVNSLSKTQNCFSYFSFKYMILSLMILYIFINRIVVFIKDRKNIKSLVFNVDIVVGGVVKKVKSFYDTGNELKEPATNLPVIIVQREVFSDILLNKNNMFYIPYTVINGESNKLVGFKPDYIDIYVDKSIEPREVIVAFCNNKLSNNDDFNALLSRGII